MKRIVLTIILCCLFIYGCEPCLNDEHFCQSCHEYGWSVSSGRNDCSYTGNAQCTHCHDPNICNRGNEYKRRYLQKNKQSSKRR